MTLRYGRSARGVILSDSFVLGARVHSKRATHKKIVLFVIKIMCLCFSCSIRSEARRAIGQPTPTTATTVGTNRRTRNDYRGDEQATRSDFRADEQANRSDCRTDEQANPRRLPSEPERLLSGRTNEPEANTERTNR